MAEERRGEPKSKTKDFMYRGPMPNPTTFAETRKKSIKREREVTRDPKMKMVPLKRKGIARKGTGPGADRAKRLPEPAAKPRFVRPGRIKLKRKTNRGTSRKSGR